MVKWTHRLGSTLVRIDRDVALAALDLFACFAPARFGGRRLHLLAVDDAGGRACLAARALAVYHQRPVMIGLEQETAHETPEPPIDRLPGRKIPRQRAPAASCTDDVADGVQHLPQVDARLAASSRRLWQERFEPLPLLVGQ